MDFVCWSMYGTPLNRDKSDALHDFLRKYAKEEAVEELPTSYKVMKRWQENLLPTLPLKAHKVKVNVPFPFAYVDNFQSSKMSDYGSGYPS